MKPGVGNSLPLVPSQASGSRSPSLETATSRDRVALLDPRFNSSPGLCCCFFGGAGPSHQNMTWIRSFSAKNCDNYPKTWFWKEKWYQGFPNRGKATFEAAPASTGAPLGTRIHLAPGTVPGTAGKSLKMEVEWENHRTKLGIFHSQVWSPEGIANGGTLQSSPGADWATEVDTPKIPSQPASCSRYPSCRSNSSRAA